MTVLILHLSDLHANVDSAPVVARGALIARSLFAFLPKADAVLVCFSGDLAYSGKPSEYAVVESFISDIVKSLKDEKDIDIHVFVAPGNHDCDFSGPQDVRDILIEQLQRTDIDSASEQILDHCASVQTAFFAFRDQVSAAPFRHHTLWDEHHLRVRDRHVVVDVLNVSWMSSLKEQPNLQFPVARFSNATETARDLRITMLHHPLNWYSQGSYRPFRRLVRTTGDIVLSGHEHHINVGENIDSESGTSAYVEGGVLHHDGSLESSFNVIEIDVDAKVYRAIPHAWDGSRYVPEPSPSMDEDGWTDFKPLQTKKTERFALAPDFEKRLRDPGAQFSHPGTAYVTLSDIFVYPDIEDLNDSNDESEVAKQLSARRLHEPSAISQGALLRGDEQAGKSTLLRRLFSDHHERGRIPLLINGRQISSATDKDLAKIVLAAVKEQYGAKSVPAFEQEPHSNKVLLLDDLDLAKAPTKSLGRVIEYFKLRFGGVVITVGNAFELSEVLNRDGLAPLRALVQYQILEFGHTRRYELASQWVTIGEGTRATADEAIALIDRAEKIMTRVLGRNLVPSYPIYLLTLLQSIEAGQQNALQNSAYGHYYQYLITSKLGELKIRPEEFDEYFHYCSQLAWFYKSSGRRQIEERFILEFHNEYCQQYVFVPFKKRIDSLVASRLLERHGDFLAFRYPYAFYFFLGKYLADRISEAEIRTLIASYCDDLAVRENANVVLFLAHHSKDPFVYERATEALKRAFAEVTPMNLETDVAVLTELIDAAPQLVFRGGEVFENRRKEREAQDSLSELEDNEDESQLETETVTNMAVSMNRLLKTVEILGQVLRNHYGSLRKEVKTEMLRQLFDGVLRGLRVVVDLLASDKALLISEIEKFLEKSGAFDSTERNSIARQAVFMILEMITHGFIRIASVYVGSEYLRDVIRDVIEERDTTAYRLVGLAIDLDQGRSLSIDTIRTLDREFKSNVIAQRLVRILVVKYLYMFRTNEKEKQQLCEELGIPMKAQRKIELRTSDTKLLPKS